MGVHEVSGAAALRHGARLAATCALVGGATGIVSGVLFAAAFGVQVGVAAPDLTTLPASRAGLVRWAALTDMLGFYLLAVPVALHLGRRFDAWRDPVVLLATVAGVVYAVIGSIGAVVVASVVPPLLGSPDAAAALVLDVVRRTVFVGLWQTLETIPWAVWMAVTGLRLRRWSRGLGGTALAIGAAALLTAVGRFVGAEPLVAPAVTVAIALYPLWLLGLGVHLMRTAAP